MRAACELLSSSGALDCGSVRSAPIPAEVKAAAVEMCDFVKSEATPRCKGQDSDDKVQRFRYDLCAAFLTKRAISEKNPEICGDVALCRAFVSGDVESCRGKTSATTGGEKPDLRFLCRKFVVHQSEKEREPVDGKMEVVARIAALNLFSESATIRARVAITKDGAAPEVTVHELGTLEPGQKVTPFDLKFQKPEGAAHEMTWEAVWK